MDNIIFPFRSDMTAYKYITHHFTTFSLKNIVQGYLMYNEFDPKHYKGKRHCTTKALYDEKTLIGRLHEHFLSEITEKSLNVL